MWNNNWESYQVKNDLYTTERCLEITRKHRNIVLNIMKVFCDKVKNLWKKHDKDKETLENLEKYTYLLNHQQEPEINEEWRQIHNCNNTHHIEWFLNCKEPKLGLHLMPLHSPYISLVLKWANHSNIHQAITTVSQMLGM